MNDSDKLILDKDMFVMGSDPLPDMTAMEFSALYDRKYSMHDIAEAYALSSNKFWWVEDEEYDFAEGTEEYLKAKSITNDWQIIMEKYEERILSYLRSKGITIPQKGIIAVLKPFMLEHGYKDAQGWWIPTDLEVSPDEPI